MNTCKLLSEKEKYKNLSSVYEEMPKKKKEVKIFDSTSNVQIVGTGELGQEADGDKCMVIKAEKNTEKSPDR